MAVPRTGSPEPDGLAPDLAAFPMPIRTVSELLIAHQHLISGALREIVRRGDDKGYLGRLVRDLEAVMPVSPAVTTALPETTWVGKSRRKDRAHAPVLGCR